MTDPTRDAAIEAAARAWYESMKYDDELPWSELDDESREQYLPAARIMVDAVLAVVGPVYRAEGVGALATLLREYAKRPPVWGPNEHGELMLDMSADDLRGDVELMIREANGEPRPARNRRDFVNVYHDDKHIGGTPCALIAGKRVWYARDLAGVDHPVGGNLAHKTREAAVAALVKAVTT